ncbi:MAG: YaeQ family protein [Congregibacter sp.]
MALKSTIIKIKLTVSDMDRHVYQDFPLAVARHPSETDARMMLRVAAFAMHADERLAFGRGISTQDEPDLWRQELNGDISLWVELGTPDPDRLRKACGRAEQVVLYAYGERRFSVWWEKHAPALARFSNLMVYEISDNEHEDLAALASQGSGLELQCTISDAELWISDSERSVEINPKLRTSTE